MRRPGDLGEFLRVRNWEKYQDANLAAKYRESGGVLPWMKQMTNRLDDYEYTRLHPLSRYIWCECIGLAAKYGPDRLPNDAGWLQERMHASFLGDQFEASLQELVKHGFLQVVSEAGTEVGTEAGTGRGTSKSKSKKEAKASGREGPEKSERPRDELWDALVEEVGTEPATRSERGMWNSSLKQLREVDATADELRRRCKAFRKQWPDITLTPSALVKWWGSLGGAVSLSKEEREAKWLQSLQERGVA
jgi:hypothetical protein